jgi:4-hydroxybenzoate polyprenyltransferase
MRKVSLYLKLIRFDKPIGTLLLLWPTLWALWLASQGLPSLRLIVVFTLGTFLMRSAGCAINDVADRQFDAHVARTAHRVVATGQVSVCEALWIAAICALSAGSLAFFYLNALALWLCVPAVALATGYPFFKRFFAIPQAILGLAFGFGIPIAYASVQNNLPLEACWLFSANFCWVLAYDTAYAMADKPDDLKLGLRTSAIFFGRHDALAVAIFSILCLALFASMMHHAHLGLLAWLGLLIASCYSTLLLYRLWQARLKLARNAVDLTQYRALCFNTFLYNNRIGFCLWLALAMDFGVNLI